MQKSLITNKPLHVQLRETLVNKISTGAWKAGEAIPNEHELAMTFGLSAGTVRKALNWMEAAKLVVRQQGRGTFVCDPADDVVFERYMRVRSADGHCLRLDYKLIDIAVVEADAFECEALAVRPGTKVRRARRQNSSKDATVSFETSTVPDALFPLPLEEARQFVSLPELAKRCGVLLGSGEERLRLARAAGEVAEMLDCPAGEQVFMYERLVMTLDGKPAEWKRGYGRLPEGHYYSVPLGFDVDALE